MTIIQGQPSPLDVAPTEMVLLSPSVAWSRKVAGGALHTNSTATSNKVGRRFPALSRLGTGRVERARLSQRRRWPAVAHRGAPRCVRWARAPPLNTERSRRLPRRDPRARIPAGTRPPPPAAALPRSASPQAPPAPSAAGRPGEPCGEPPHLRGTRGASGLSPQPHRKMEPVRPAMPAPPPAPSPPRPAHGPRSPRAGAPRPVPAVAALPAHNPLLSASLKGACEMPGCLSGRSRA
ncbi:proline-rich protein 2-like isoform X2 [Passer montanus]|uniref:proline-rich protein 2-like isoform X2 n=1 Tax=Passer montanus TaxID=9160 RepID=UPI00195F9030|nr:proline-rich protein 2-like isoform X2 [Passer montanus]